jgi:hypothetical protein
MNQKKPRGRVTGPVTQPQTLTSTDNRGDDSLCQARSLPPAGIKTSPSPEQGGKKGHFCRPLAIQFRRGGFNYRQIYREGDAAIYVQGWTGSSDPSVCYEVIRIRRHEGFKIAGKFIEPAEVYPCSEAWGTDGFTYTDKERAFTKFQQIVAGRTGKNQLEQAGGDLGQEPNTTTPTRTNNPNSNP